jgi:hypothetical protein
MIDFDPTVSKALTSAIQELRESSPEITDILDKAKSGDMDEATAMRNLMEAVASNPEASKRFQDVMMRNLATTRGSGIKPVAPISPGFNPLVQGALVERAQFDGDMPELRTGNIPMGVMPAVPIKTKARNPVAIGAMLGTASKLVRRELDKKMDERRRMIEADMATDPNALAILRKHGELASHGDAGTALAGTAATDPEGYRRGEVPKPLAVNRPSGASLAKMTEPQKHEMAWRFLSTTQGRMSAVEIIRDTIADQLRKRGLVVEEREFNSHAPRVQPLAYAEWTVTLSGPGATQPAFALVDVSSKVLAQRLWEGLDGNKPDKCFLEVESVNRISDREVGWMARVLLG